MDEVQETVIRYCDSSKVYKPSSFDGLDSDSGFNISSYNTWVEEMKNEEAMKRNELKYKSRGFKKEMKIKYMKTQKNDSNPENVISPLEDEVLDLSVSKSQNITHTSPEDPICRIDLRNDFETSSKMQDSSEVGTIAGVENDVPNISTERYGIQNQITKNDNQISNVNSVQEAEIFESPDKYLNDRSVTSPNDNLLLLAHCSLIHSDLINKENKSSEDCSLPLKNRTSKMQLQSAGDPIIKCSVRYDKLFNTSSDEVNSQQGIPVDLSLTKVEKKLPSDNHSSKHCNIVRSDHETQSTSAVNVNKFFTKRKAQNEERIPKIVIKQIEGKYCSYFKKE